MRVDAVVKVGGSLIRSRGLEPLLASLVRLARSAALVVVPGGGGLADAVRRRCAVADPGADAAHWMAILAMDQNAHYLAGLADGAELVRGKEELRRHRGGSLVVLAPFSWLFEADPLPHSWDVTSDSIAAWVAGGILAQRLVLLKSLPGVLGARRSVLPGVDAATAASRGVVDAYFPRALRPGTECWILSGRHPGRLEDLMREGSARGTRIGAGPAPRAGPAPGKR